MHPESAPPSPKSANRAKRPSAMPFSISRAKNAPVPANGSSTATRSSSMRAEKRLSSKDAQLRKMKSTISRGVYTTPKRSESFLKAPAKKPSYSRRTVSCRSVSVWATEERRRTWS